MFDDCDFMLVLYFGKNTFHFYSDTERSVSFVYLPFQRIYSFFLLL